MHEEFPLLYLDSHALRSWELTVSDGLFLSVDLSGPTDRIVGLPRPTEQPPDRPLTPARIRLARLLGAGLPGAGSRIVLEPEIFYLLLSAEGVCIPPGYAAEMTAYDPTAGSSGPTTPGFFDPGFGYDASGRRHGI